MEGESLMTSGKCLYCEGPTFYLLEQQDIPGSCETCQTDRSICLGGANIGPTEGYWRSGVESD